MPPLRIDHVLLNAHPLWRLAAEDGAAASGAAAGAAAGTAGSNIRSRGISEDASSTASGRTLAADPQHVQEAPPPVSRAGLETAASAAPALSAVTCRILDAELTARATAILSDHYPILCDLPVPNRHG
jgi:hypothetical protein